jgi:hypothetical protein
MLPDVALLRIFDFYLPMFIGLGDKRKQLQTWHTLVHVCRKWRNVVFGSPRRLELRLYCEARTPARKMLNIWPLVPIDVSCNGHKKWGVDNIIAALEHSDRIWDLDFIDTPSPRSQFHKVLAAMQQPVPMLRRLLLWFEDGTAPVVPDSFLGGSAPQLETLSLSRIPFPGLPILLLSTTHLVDLILSTIPHSGYISPEAMVTGLSALTGLERLTIRFESHRSRPDLKSRRPPPLTRTILPALNSLELKGASEYLDDVVAQIDAPLLNYFRITFFYQPTFETPRLAQFISRTPKLKAHNKARVFFCNEYVSLETVDKRLLLEISCGRSDWQFSSLAQVCSSSFPQAFIPTVEHLYFLENGYWRLQHDIEINQWLELLRPFSGVKHLYICSGFIRSIAPALQDLVGERVTEVLPALQTLFLDKMLSPKLDPEVIFGKFVAARELASHPITISLWQSEFNSNPMPYICSRGYPLYFRPFPYAK